MAVITDDVLAGVNSKDALNHIKLITIINDVSLRNLIPNELPKQFLRTYKNKKKELILSNNGVMKHLERFKKMINFVIKLEWILKNPLVLVYIHLFSSPFGLTYNQIFEVQK